MFRPGPVFTHLLLADEINRTPPKTQAALLEAMAEGQVSVDGKTRPLPRPFVVLATDNPIEYEGTYAAARGPARPVPAAGPHGLPAAGRRGRDAAAPPGPQGRARATWRASSTPTSCWRCAPRWRRSTSTPTSLDYVVALVNATRAATQVQVGASPRGGLALVQLARARAVLSGRDYVIPEDVKAVAVPALAHRISLRPELWVRRVSADEVVASLLTATPTPRTLPRQQDAVRGPVPVLPNGAAGPAAPNRGTNPAQNQDQAQKQDTAQNHDPAQKPAGAHR